MHNNTVKQLSEALRNKKFSSEELVYWYLERCQVHNTNLNCFINLIPEQAIEQAKKADTAIQKGHTNPLLGIPVAHKDIFCTKDIKTTCGSKMLDNFIAPYDATVVAHLNDAGMITLGKTNMDEFAMGSSSETSFYGAVKNPWDTQRTAGGSSGGSAAAVSAKLVPIATGTDTGGSIRQPAALCGTTGLKPTYGRISRYGMIAYASSLDQAGPIAQTAEDAAIMLNAMAGFDERDSTSVQEKTEDYTAAINNSIVGITVGLAREYFEKLDPKVANVINAGIKALEDLGVKVKEISLPNISMSIPTYYVIASAECSSNLARFDGIRFGYRCDSPQDLADLYLRSRSEAFGKEVKRRIMTGTYVLSSGYYDAYYLKAQKVRRLIRDELCHALTQVDVIIGPTTPHPAGKLNELLNDDPVNMYLLDIYTVSANLAGLPAISIPAGQIDNMPIGMQITGNYFSESKLLNIAHKFQQTTNWHQHSPKGFEQP